MKKPMSRQRRYQLRHRRLGLCGKCSNPAELGSLCRKHGVEQRERSRKRMGAKRRNLGAPSYSVDNRLYDSGPR